MIAKLRKEKERLLLLDCGDLLSEKAEEEAEMSETAFDILEKLGYDGKNLGRNDFNLGTEFLNTIRNRVTFPFITSNLVYRDTGKPFGERYVIKEMKGIKVGILGIVPVSEFSLISESNDIDDFRILPPESALKPLVRELRDKVNLIVLLSQCGHDATNTIVKKVEGIDLAITDQTIAIKPDELNCVVQARRQGATLQMLDIFLNENGRLKNSYKTSVKLDHEVRMHSKIVAMIEAAGEKKKQRQRNELMSEVKKLHELTPMEYYEMVSKQETETNKELKRREGNAN